MREPARFMRYVNAMFHAMWVEPCNLATRPCRRDAGKGGLRRRAARGAGGRRRSQARLIAITEEAVRRGVFGAPTMFVGDAMFFGQDRLEFVREALALSLSPRAGGE